MSRSFHSIAGSAVQSVPFTSVSVLREETIFQVRPDFLVGYWATTPEPIPGKLSGTDLHLLAEVLRGELSSASDFEQNYFMSRAAAASSLQRMRRSGLLTVDADGRFSSAFQLGDRCHIVAFELKLDRWREALEQAISYQKFANESYVVLDASRIKVTSDPIRECASRNVGFVILYRDDEMEILLRGLHLQDV